jgi:Domain of Unknown Function (DUF1080)
MIRPITLILVALVLVSAGCSDQRPADSSPIPQPISQAEQAAAMATANELPLDLTVGTGDIQLAAYEMNAEKLLQAQLPPEKLKQGWVRLFDGHTLAGWSIMGNADWSCKDGVIRVSRGDSSFLVTNFDIADYEISIDFRAATETNSGVFLRTAPEPGDVSVDCLELNIAPPQNPYPTGSLVKRKKSEPSQLPDGFDPTQWHTFHVRLEGEAVSISLDGKLLYEYVDETSAHRGYISLQHNQGIAEFRNILLRPLSAKSLKVNQDWHEDWSVGEKESGKMKVAPSDAGLHIHGGLGKVQTKESFGDFWLQARYSLATPEVNSGIFFRCIEDSMLDGYECQINHAVKGNDPLAPRDAGAGAIFRRKDARLVVGEGVQPTYLSLLVTGNQIVTWINGIIVTEFTDDRMPDLNPRKGKRLEAGPIALQGHDPTTDITFEKIEITTLR